MKGEGGSKENWRGDGEGRGMPEMKYGNGEEGGMYE